MRPAEALLAEQCIVGSSRCALSGPGWRMDGRKHGIRDAIGHWSGPGRRYIILSAVAFFRSSVSPDPWPPVHRRHALGPKPSGPKRRRSVRPNGSNMILHRSCRPSVVNSFTAHMTAMCFYVYEPISIRYWLQLLPKAPSGHHITLTICLSFRLSVLRGL